MAIWTFWARRTPNIPNINAAYAAIVRAARAPALYRIGAPDDFDGRFDMMVLHVHLVLRRLRALGQGRGKVAQALFDQFFQTMDEDLREMGVGDLSVGKKIRKMAQAYYGRVAAYDTAFMAADTQAALAAVLARNLYPNGITPNGRADMALDALAAYIIGQEKHLMTRSQAHIMAGDIFTDA